MNWLEFAITVFSALMIGLAVGFALGSQYGWKNGRYDRQL